MSPNSPHNDDRMLAYLADDAIAETEGTDAASLGGSPAMVPGVDADAFAKAAVVARTGAPLGKEALPESLRGKLLADARKFFAQRDGT